MPRRLGPMLAVLALLLAGCAGDGAGDPGSVAMATSSASATSSPTPPPPPPPSWSEDESDGEVRSAGTINPGQSTERPAFEVPDGALQVWLNLTLDVQGAGEFDVQYVPPGCTVGDTACNIEDATSGQTLSILVEEPTPGSWEFLLYAQQAAVGSWTLQVNSLLPVTEA